MNGPQLIPGPPKKCGGCHRVTSFFVPSLLASKGGARTSYCSRVCQNNRNVIKKRYGKTQKGQETQARSRHTEAGRANDARGKKRAKEKYKNHESHRLFVALHERAKNLYTHFIQTSPQFRQHTGWDEATFIAHLDQTTAHDAALRRASFGKGLEQKSIGHKIPCAYYDFSDPNDVMRCWSAPNVCLEWWSDNKDKQANIDLNLAATIPIAQRPAAWAVYPNHIPTPAQAEALRNARF